MSENVCDHTSVGMLVWQNEALLLIERAKPPYGLAPPAGHVDGDASFEIAAARELQEEVYLTADSLELVLEKDKNNSCRRKDGTWHHWKIYKVDASGDVRRSRDETNGAGWYPRPRLQSLAERTLEYLEGHVSEEEWRAEPGLEPVWREHLKDLNIVV